MDGEVFITTSGTISLFFNDIGIEHNLTIYFSGETYEYIFNTSIDETIALACKSINSIVMYDEIFTVIPSMSIDLLFNGVVIQTVVSDSEGLISISGLIIGDYVLAKTGLTEGLEFSIEQDIVVYESDILIAPKKTILNIDYVQSLTGDTTVDLSTIEWDIGLWGTSHTVWVPLTLYPTYFDGITFDDATGMITIYNLKAQTYPWELKIDNYAGELDTCFVITINAVNQINLEAKSLEAEFLWSADSLPVVGESFELFVQDGIEWISLGTYITDVNGKVILINNLPIGVYKFDDMTEFSILANDNVKIVVSTIESLCVKKSFYLRFIRDSESKFFSFFGLFTLNLDFRAVDKITGFLSFGFRPSFFMHYCQLLAYIYILEE